MRRYQPGEFDTFLFADYSGAANAAAQRRAIALFRLDARREAPEKVEGPFTRATLRAAIVAQLEQASASGRRVLFGIDHQWSWPRDLLATARVAGAPWRRALALLVAGHQSLPPLGPASSYGQAFNRATGDAIFHSRLRGLAKKYGVPRASTWGGNPVRLVETLMPGAKPATRLGGTGAVAGQTLAGLRELHELFSELKRRGLRVQAWPFDTLHDDGSSHVGCEIYPGHCRRELGEAGRALVRPEWSEHDRDAALTCVWAQGAPLGALLDLRNARSAQRRAARTEGWILGARGTPSASKEIPVNDSKSANDRSLS